jgi:adenosylcobinamide kinase / adenosylcobinamide-phosphate guanylyltransferase
LAEAAAPRRLFLVTAEARDDEMHARIARHKADRPFGWTTLEEALEIAGVLQAQGSTDQSIVVDCLTLWLSNLFECRRDVELETRRLCAALATARAQIFLVSNEIGLGLVPESPLGRAFRDAQGRLNQRIAAQADVVEFVAAGLPLRLKG